MSRRVPNEPPAEYDGPPLEEHPQAARHKTFDERVDEETAARLAVAMAEFAPRSAADLGPAFDAAPARQWLVKRLFAEDHYGVMAAPTKAFKTWAAGALAVAVTTGKPWLGQWEIEKTGPVVMFWGEGGWKAAVRRMRGIAQHYGEEFEGLPIYIVDRVPSLLDGIHMQAVRHHLEEIRPALVVVDPAFLAVLGVNLAAAEQVYDALNRLRLICDSVGAALLFVHHNKKTGEATGHNAMSGAGFAAWGRSLISITWSQCEPEFDGQSARDLTFEATGGEAADVTWHTRVRVSAVDPDDLDSPMRYSDEPIGALEAGSASQMTAVARVQAALAAAGRWVTASDVQEHSARNLPAPDSLPLKQDTVRKTLDRLAADGKVQKRASETGGANRYAAPGVSSSDPLDEPF